MFPQHPSNTTLQSSVNVAAERQDQRNKKELRENKIPFKNESPRKAQSNLIPRKTLFKRRGLIICCQLCFIRLALQLALTHPEEKANSSLTDI
ncbi:hypothetical protein XELAEV_18023225mg [Xenopus laevis]|uniref:Uncharacterized protein n=1 Tax=Xenopus laevis TaxID=8355 RepID=A0A974D6F1_XENLA|nr:hypothetical protein XELAEV_18023225mg [Xenopus laevis]